MSARPHVLVARQDNDGDVLLAGPAVRAAAAGAARGHAARRPARRARRPSCCPASTGSWSRRRAWIDAQPRPVSRAAVDATVDRLAAVGADVGIVLTSFHQSPLPLALLLRLAGVPRLGAISVDYPGSLLDVRHHVADDVHEVERSLSLLAAMGFALPPGDDGALRVTGLPPVDGALRRRAVRRRAPRCLGPGAGVGAGAPCRARRRARGLGAARGRDRRVRASAR